MIINVIYQDLLRLNPMKKIEIELVLPQGALFYHNINLFIYKQYINFLYKLNCFAVDQKCFSCPFSKECYYYHCTGENFKYYPNILIENPIFTQAIFQKEGILKISFFIIGEDTKHINYLKLFFQSYLNQKIQGYFFYLKNINMIDCNQKNISLNHIMISSCIKTTHFTDEYNQMINYYNKRYLTQYNNLSNCMIDIKNIKHSQQEGIQFKTKKIVPRGFTYQILFNENINIPLDILYIGIGNFNFIGGGELET